MTAHVTRSAVPQRALLQSVGAIVSGFVVVFVLSLGVDQLLHVMQVYPPLGQPMWDHRLNALALSYRLVIGVLGSYVTARLAPYAPMRHAMIGAAIGFVLSTLGAIAAIRMQLGPAWYPIALAASALPTGWLGGRLGAKMRA
jgi:glycerol uptake facilitator-like aquaporin